MLIYDLQVGTNDIEVKQVFVGETRVVLITDRFNPEPAEPVRGSKYECTGTIIEILPRGDEYDVQVEWDNGHVNPYIINHLRAVYSLDVKNPNHAFKKWRTKNGTRKSKQKF